MRPYRLILTIVLAALIAPTVWLRSEIPKTKPDRVGRIDAIGHAPARSGPFRLVGAWELTGSAPMFGGFSALAILSGDRFLAGTDGGRKIVFIRPDKAGPPPELSRFGPRGDVDKIAADLESLTEDPDTGLLWGGYESTNSIRRFGPDLVEQGSIRPVGMRAWGANSGPEAFGRLPDGRFVAIEERATRWFGERHRALLFPTDPLSGDAGEPFTVGVPEGFRPVDLVAVSRDRALVLLRRVAFGFPPHFDTAIAELDVGQVRDGKVVNLSKVATLGAGFPAENYEGMALTRDRDGAHVWLISDDNLMQHQHSYILKLRWDDKAKRQKARE